jgi:hypothetical protein
MTRKLSLGEIIGWALLGVSLIVGFGMTALAPI